MIRPAVSGDAAALSRLHRAARHAAYAGWGAPDQLDGPFDEAWWRGRLTDDSVAFVAEADGAVAGLALLEDDCLDQLYVDPTLLRSGWGGRLFDAAVSAGACWLWVYEPNAPARAFYEARGWLADPDSTHVDPTWSISVPALKYRAPA